MKKSRFIRSMESRKEMIFSLIATKKAYQKFNDDNTADFKKWAKSKFVYDNSIDGYEVTIRDKTKYEYRFIIVDNILKMSVDLNRDALYKQRRGFMMHPMEMMEMMMEEREPVIFYEGGIIPEKEVAESYLELLKNDLLTKGELTTAIKKFIHDDRAMRIENDKLRQLVDEQLNQMLSETTVMYEDEFRESNFGKLCKRRTTLTREAFVFKFPFIDKINFVKEAQDDIVIKCFYNNGEAPQMVALPKKKFLTTYISTSKQVFTDDYDNTRKN